MSKGRERLLKTKEVGVAIRPGDWFLVESAGGGGYGPPSKRDPAARAADVENGFVSPKSSPRRAPSPRAKRRRR
jgi:N-methylhydantoinase B